MTMPLACSMADPLDCRWILAFNFMGPRASKECAASLVRGDKYLREGRSLAIEKKLQGGNGFPLGDGACRSRRSTIASVEPLLLKLSEGAPQPWRSAGRNSGSAIGPRSAIRSSFVNHPIARARRPFRLMRRQRHR